MKAVKEIVGIFIRKKVARAAAQLSYTLTLSLFPMLICINAMLAGFDITEADILKYGEGIIPATSVKFIMDYISYVGENFSPAMLAAALLLVATTSSASFRAIMVIMSEIQGEPRYRGFWPTIVSFVYSLVFIASIYLSIVVIVSGNWFINLMQENFGNFHLSGLWNWLRFILLFFILLAIIYGVYRLSAPKEKPRRQRLLGACLAAVAMVVASMFFSWTIEMSAKYPLIYGSLASIIILMIWLFICGEILIAGNIVNVVFNSHRRELALNKAENNRSGGVGKE